MCNKTIQSNQFKPTFKNVLYWASGSNGCCCQIRNYFKNLKFTLLLQMNCNSPCFYTSKDNFELSIYLLHHSSHLSQKKKLCLLPLTDSYFDSFFLWVHIHLLPQYPQLKILVQPELQSSKPVQKSRCIFAGTERH